MIVKILEDTRTV